MDILTALGCADSLYKERGRAGAVNKSVTVLASLPDGADRYEAQWRLARALFFLGQEADNEVSSRQLHAAGIGAGERATRLNPDRVEGRFWLGVNLALFAQTAGGLQAAGVVLRARRELRHAARINESYHGAGPLRVLGRLEHKAPWFLGGSAARSGKYFDRALEIAPTNSVTMLYAVELFLDCGERDRAVAVIKRIIDLPVDPEWEFENRRDRKIARGLLESLSGAGPCG